MEIGGCFFTLFLVVYGVSSQTHRVYNFCITESKMSSLECNILKKVDSRFNCVNVKDSTDCALKLGRGEADFGFFTAEEAILTSKFDYNDERVVVGELLNNERIDEKFKFETVAIVKSDFEGPLKNLKGKNFCHPGFSKSQIWTDRVLKHFERVVLNRTVVCEKSSRSAVEDELNAISTFFGKACRPGEWVPSELPNLDFRLKQLQYPNLCALCDSVKGCSYNSQADGNQFATLDCLTKRGGDVAYVANYYVQRYFGKVGVPQRSHINMQDYKYLCPNGSTQSLSGTQNPCTWIAQPWDPIVARNAEVANGLKIELQKWLPTEQQVRSINDWVDVFVRIVVSNDKKLVMKPGIIDLKKFIQAGRDIPEAGTTLPCQQPLKWCTVSAKENEKCEWLRQAGITEGIVPELQCIQATSKINCLQKLKSGEADILGIDANIGTISSHYYNLSTALYQETEGDGNFRVVAIVKNDLAASNLKDLKNKRACFPEFGGLAWTAFVENIHSSESKFCAYDNSMGDYLLSSCAPGANKRLGSDNSTAEKFCKVCSDAFSADGINWVPFTKEESCDATIRNKFYGDVGALRCLGTGVADFAIINAYNLSSNLKDDLLSEDFSSKFSIMCRNGTKIPLSKTLDDNCAITTVTGGEVVARRSRSIPESRDIVITLLKFSDWFGYYIYHHENIFHMFEPFDGVIDLLFRKEALDFITTSDKDEEPYMAVRSYANLKDAAEKCEELKSPDGAQSIQVHTSAVVFMLLAIVIQVLVMF